MGVYETVLQAAREAALATVGEPSEFDGAGIGDELVEGASDAIVSVLPEHDDVEPDWIKGIIDARPGLLAMPSSGGTPAQALLIALADLLLDELEPDILEHARDKGFDIPKPMTP